MHLPAKYYRIDDHSQAELHGSVAWVSTQYQGGLQSLVPCPLPLLQQNQYRDFRIILEIEQLLPALVLYGWESRKDCRKNRFGQLLWKAASKTRHVREFGLDGSWVSFHNFSSFWHEYFIKTRVQILGKKYPCALAMTVSTLPQPQMKT